MSRIILLKTGDNRTEGFLAYCKELGRVLPGIACLEKKSDGFPGLMLKENLIYRALPAGREKEPFLEAIKLAESGAASTSIPVNERIREIDVPASLRVFVTNECPFCPSVVRVFIPLALLNPLISVEIVDGMLFTELPSEANIRSVPTVLLDGEIRWTGTVKVDEVLDALESRNPMKMSPSSLEGLLKDGRAGMLAKTMAGRGMVFPGLLELLSHPSWPVRMGAMVAMEELRDLNAGLAAAAVDSLLGMIPDAPDSARGDIIYVIGEIGGASDTAKIKALMAGNLAEDVREAAQEALDKLSRGSDS